MIEVILREDVKSLGKAGELVRVKPGYARNFLLPQGLAYEATEGNKKRIEAETRARGARDQAERAEAERFAATLGAVAVTLDGQGRRGGQAVRLDHRAGHRRRPSRPQGHQVDKRRIELEHPIKTLGTTPWRSGCTPEVHAEVRVSVVAE